MPLRARQLVFSTLVILITPALSDAQGSGDTHPYLTKKYFASAGVFLPDRTLKFEFDGSVPAIDSTVDFSERFRLDGTDESASVEIGWRFKEAWLLRAQYFRVDDSSTAVLEDDLQWGDALFSAGTGAAAGTDVQVTRFFVGRRYRQGDQWEVGIGGGLHFLDIEAFVRGDAIVNGMPVGFLEEAVGTDGPMPNIGAWYNYSLSANWVLNARLDWLSVEVDKYDGRIINAAIGINYALFQHFGLAVSYNYFELDIGIDDGSWQGRAINRFDGGYVSLTAYW